MAGEADAVKWELLPYINGEGLDLGCGDARQHDWMFGIDTKPGTSDKGPNRLLDATKLTGYFAPESQNFIFSSFLLQDLQDWPKVLKDWWSLIKPMGYLILFGPIVMEGDDKKLVACMEQNKPYKFCEAQTNGQKYFMVFQKADLPTVTEVPKPEKICAVMKLGANGDALWASSVFPHLKEQGYTVWLYCQETTEEVLRHDPHIDRIIRFESRVPMGELGALFGWMESKYKNSRILVECVEGTLLPSPQKIQYHFPKALRNKVMNFNYLEMHHHVARVPLEPRMKFYPNDAEKAWANQFRSTLRPYVAAIVPNGSSLTKSWPYASDLIRKLAAREDVSVVVLGDERGVDRIEAPNVHNIFCGWGIRQAMTFVQLANVVVGQETGLTNCVGFEKDVRKVLLLTHSDRDQLSKGWPNTATMAGDVPCWPCHRLHYDWSNCQRSPVTQLAECQTAIRLEDVMAEVLVAIPYVEPLVSKQARRIKELEAALACFAKPQQEKIVNVETEILKVPTVREPITVEHIDPAAGVPHEYSEPTEIHEYSQPTSITEPEQQGA